MNWLAFQSDQETKFAAFSGRSTFGSAQGSQICWPGRTLKPLQGQFLQEENSIYYQDFSTKQMLPLQAKEAQLLLQWQVKVGSEEWLIETYRTLLVSRFKNLLQQHTHLAPLDVLEILKKEFFLSESLPQKLSHLLLSQYQQISLSSPVETLLEDPEVSDILIESHNQIFVERRGHLERSHYGFSDEQTYRLYIENLLAEAHCTLDEAHPYVDFILSNGSRGHLIGPPLTSGSYYLSVRKKRLSYFTLEHLFERQMLSGEQRRVVERLIAERKNILISGATGSGKTTLMKAILAATSAQERVVVMEDTPELAIDRPNTAYLYSRAESKSHLPPVTLRDLVRQSLRMRPDRVLIGEVRGEEAFDLLQAMNTGHSGSMGSLHANSARDAIYRLQGLVRMSNAALAEDVTRNLIARNVHVILHCGKDPHGQRRLLEIGLLQGVDGNQIILEVLT